MPEINDLFCFALVSYLLALVRSQSTVILLPIANITFRNSGSATQFTVSSELGHRFKLTYDTYWLGIGFNSEPKMSGATVVICNCDANDHHFRHFYNSADQTALLDSKNPSIGIKSTSFEYVTVNGVYNHIVCKFTRDNSNSNSKYFNLNSASAYILIAYGPVSNNFPRYHMETEITKNKVYFGPATTSTRTTTTIVQSTKAQSTKAQTIDQLNVTKKSDTYYGSFEEQGYLLSWIDTPNYTDFTFTSPSLNTRRIKRDVIVPRLNNIYISFALSTDNKMGDDDVIACKVSGNVGIVERYYNPSSGAPIYMDSSNPTLGLSNTNIISYNSVIFCSFRRAKATNGSIRYFDLNNNYYILVAQGVVNQSKDLAYHGTSRFSSRSSISIQSNSSITGSSRQNNDKAKAHGAIMVIAWMLIASTGILFARYYRFLDIEIHEKPFWFQMHRALMLSVTVISFVSFIVILSDLQWKWVNQNVSLNFAHSIIGIITICLSFIQVIMAFARPHRGTQRRPLFNYIHRTVGLSALILPIVSIFLGVCIDRMNMGQFGWGIMIGWTFWVIVSPKLVEIVQVIYTTSKTNSEMETFYINGKKAILSIDDIEINKKVIDSVKKSFIHFHLFAAVAFSMALIFVIALSKPSYISENFFKYSAVLN